MQKNRIKQNFLYLVVDIVLVLYCVLCIHELKWKLLLLPQGGLILIRIAKEWLEDAGKTKQASMLEKIRKVISVVFIAICIIVLFGCLVGLWDL